MTKEELRRLIAELDEKFQKRKFRRLIITFLAFAAVFWYLLIKVENVVSLETFFGSILGALFLSGIYMYVNILVFGFLFRKSEDENKALEILKKELKEMEKEDSV